MTTQIGTQHRAALALLVAASLWGPSSLRAQVRDPHLTWRTLSTEHFDVTYHEPLGPLARHVARAAERANTTLASTLRLSTDERTYILLTDTTDSANGFAGVTPRNSIRLFAAAPDDLSPIGDYDDWLATLVTHEHTHIVHLDTIGGIPALLNAVFGKTTAPNILQPRWFIEGLATHYESRLTSAGRVRASMFEMYLRADVLADRVPRLDQLSHDPRRWPHGDLAYLYGSRFVRFIAERHGEQALTDIGRDFGNQIVPFAMNRSAKRATGQTFVQLYDEFIEALKKQHHEKAMGIAATGLVEGAQRTPHADIARAPRFLEDGRLVYYRADGRSEGQLRLLTIGASSHDLQVGEQLVRTRGRSTPAPHPDGRRLMFSSVAPHRDVYAFHDLFEVDLVTGDVTRRTHGLRAREPDVSPDGRRVAFVRAGVGRTRLAIAQWTDIEDTTQVLLEDTDYEQVFTPRWSPDGKRIALSGFRAGGYRDIVVVDVDSGRADRITEDRAQDSGPTWSPDGHMLYFASDRTGVSNIHAFDLRTGRTFQVTNVMTGAYQPVVSHDGSTLAYVGYGAEGFGIHALPLAHITPRPAAPYQDTRPSPRPPAEGPLPEPQDYNPLPTLTPGSYRVEVEPGTFDTELAFFFDGSDIARYHAYAARYGVSVDSGQSTFDLRYSFRRLPLVPSLRLFRRFDARSDLIVGGERRRWAADSTGASASASYRFPGLFASQSVSLRYTLEHVGKGRPFGGALDPNDPPPRLPQLGFIPSAGFSWRYSSIQRHAYDISPSGGHAIRLSVSFTDPVMGRSLRSVRTGWSARKFFAIPGLDHHVLGMRYAGGQAAGDTGRVSSFSLGGFPDASPFFSVYDLIVLGTVPQLGGRALRGYAPGARAGPQFHLLQTEYRLPLWRAERGLYTLPFYIRRVYALVFADYGNAFSGRINFDDFIAGTGAELFTNLVLSYRVSITLRMGIARGLNQGGETQFYFHLGTPF